MNINDEGRSNASYWHERAMKAEARLAESERWLRKVVDDHYMVPQARRYLARLTDSADEVHK